jgi:uncharacterized Fe-S center protein
MRAAILILAIAISSQASTLDSAQALAGRAVAVAAVMAGHGAAAVAGAAPIVAAGAQQLAADAGAALDTARADASKSCLQLRLAALVRPLRAMELATYAARCND